MIEYIYVYTMYISVIEVLSSWQRLLLLRRSNVPLKISLVGGRADNQEDGEEKEEEEERGGGRGGKNIETT